MTPITDPTREPEWRPVSMPMPRPEFALAAPNSLWRPGARAFFKDQRAAQVGDVVTVVVSIGDNAVLNNGTTATRTGQPSARASGPVRPAIVVDPCAAARHRPDTSWCRPTRPVSAVGTGNITRNELVQLRVAGTVTQVLPNGNLAIAGRQEVRVNSELRNLEISGIVRPAGHPVR